MAASTPQQRVAVITPPQALAPRPPHDLEFTMHALKDLFSTDYGLMSIGGIVFMLGMGAFFLRYFLRHMHEDEARAASQARR
jgi:hypothetical protein